jgi:hypothetical protein
MNLKVCSHAAALGTLDPVPREDQGLGAPIWLSVKIMCKCQFKKCWNILSIAKRSTLMSLDRRPLSPKNI